ncbi:LysE family transporter [Mesoterricola sediminis]|uniref:Threonine/homoserine/homoserine lactone efflux protein n=1 Tax=Mesoterricola sediminis TaxID=2927980 RepID=A0AA48GQZ3_9BACT|nr:LysE family transporter [Mesoterricola sediminis]BDU75999.1 hypothetical protein METESE_09570 [Mesoterricola sediminis]
MLEGIPGNVIALVVANGAVLIVPGLNFALVSRTSLECGLRFGLMTALGITSGIMVHVALAMYGSYRIFAKHPFLFGVVKWMGVAYILWMALKLTRGLLSAPASGKPGSSRPPSGGCFRNGFLVDLFNPYVTLFYVSVFSQIMATEAGLATLSAYGVVIFVLTLGWFALVALVFAHPASRKVYEDHWKAIEALSASLLVFFAVKLALT